MNTTHDTGYRQLFSHPTMVRDLLLGFGAGEWVKQADFSTLERVNSSYVSDSARQRHDDMVWRLKVGGNWLWVYLVLEFQREPDPWMALRMMVYVGLLAQNLVREGEIIDGQLPPIMPIVLYNGQPVWKAALDVADCFIAPPAGLERFTPRLAYHLIDEGRLKHHPLTEMQNFAEALFRLEFSREKGDAHAVLHALVALLQAPEMQDLRRHFNSWVQSRLQQLAPTSKIDEINDIFEGKNMLAENFARWIDEARLEGKTEGWESGRAEGWAGGRAEGEANVLARQLTRRFGPLPAWADARLRAADAAQLEVWADAVLDAASLDEVMGVPPERH
jgi:predicted transposase YdaD